MNNLDKYTPTELLKIGNDIKVKHDALKQKIVDDTYELEKLEESLNKKLSELATLEKNYVEIVGRLTEQ